MSLVSLVVCCLCAAGAPARAATLPGLSAAERVERLAAAAASDPAARVLAAVAADPALLESRADEFAAIVGAANLPALEAEALSLNVAARGDEAAMRRLQALAASAGADEVLDQARRFDGSAASGLLAPALSQPVGPEAEHEPIVRSLSRRAGRWLVNGAQAGDYQRPRVDDGVAKHALLHPTEPGVLLRVYHSPRSLEAFERRDAKLRALRPLSESGAAPALIESGEAVVPGKGRVYYLAQRLADGLPLADLPAPARPWREVGRLLDRLARAGLALQAPGPDLSAALARVRIAKDEEGAPRAYLLGARTRPLEPRELAAHDGMLRAALDSLARDSSALDAGAARLGALPGPVEAPFRILARRAGAQELSEAATEQEAADAAARLLGDPEVERVLVPDTVRRALERRANKDLAAALGRVPPGPRRDKLILEMPEAAYARTASADVAAILRLLSAEAGVAALPRAAWLSLEPGDLAELVRARLLSAGALEIARAWIAARGDALPLRERARVIALLPESSERNALLAAIPAAAWEAACGADAAAALALEFAKTVSRLGVTKHDDLFAKVPDAVWAAMSLQDAWGLVQRWLPLSGWTAAQVAKRWLDKKPGGLGAPGASAEGVAGFLGVLDEGRGRDELVLSIPGPVYASASSAEIAATLALLSRRVDREVERLPAEAWRGLSQGDLEGLVKRRVADGEHDAARHLASRWLAARAGEVSVKEALPISRALVEGEQRDRLIESLTDAVFAGAPSADVAALLSLLSRRVDSELERFAPEAWRRLSLPDAEALIEARRARGDVKAARYLAKLSLAAHAADASWDVARRLVAAFEEGDDKDRLIEALPGELWAKAPSAGAGAMIAAMSERADSEHERLAPQAWAALDADVARRLIETRVSRGQRRAARYLSKLWLAAHAESASWRDVVDLVSRFESGDERDRLIESIPGASWAKAGSPQTAAMLERLSDRVDSELQRLAPEAWKGLLPGDAEALISRRLALGRLRAARYLTQLWLSGHAETVAWPEVQRLVERFEDGSERDRLVEAIPGEAWAKADSQAAARMIGLQGHGVDSELQRLPAQAWRALRVEDLEGLIAARAARKEWAAARYLAQLWLAAREGPAPAWRQVEELIDRIADRGQKDKLVEAIPGEAWSQAASASIAALLGGMSDSVDRELERLAPQAWKGLQRNELVGLVRATVARKRRAAARYTLQLWLGAHADELSWAQTRELVDELSRDSGERARLVASLPESLCAKADSLEMLNLLGTLTLDALERAPAAAWRRLDEHAMLLLAAEKRSEAKDSAARIEKLWRKAADEGQEPPAEPAAVAAINAAPGGNSNAKGLVVAAALLSGRPIGAFAAEYSAAPGGSSEARAVVTAAAALSGRPLHELTLEYEKASGGSSAARAILVAAAAFTAKTVHALNEDYARAEAGSSDARALLTAAAALSGRSIHALNEDYARVQAGSNRRRALLALSAALTGRPLDALEADYAAAESGSGDGRAILASAASAAGVSVGALSADAKPLAVRSGKSGAVLAGATALSGRLDPRRAFMLLVLPDDD